jgi:YD repeat-containing protein
VSTNVAGPFNGGSNVPSQQVQHFSGAAPPISFSNNVTTLGGNSALTGTATLTESSHQEQLTAMDEAGVTHIYKFDGLGRMSEADGVLYTYDTLDNLQGVSGQPRTFTFSSLSRLVQATNPESTTTSYKYDFNGNVLSMTDGQGRATCFGTWTGSACDSSQYGYDPLNRPRKRSYSDGTPIVTYTYDQDIKGALYSVETTAQNKTTYTRDSLGRITGSAQITAGSSPYTFTYSYDRADFLTSMTYPSGRIVNYTPNNANQVAAIADPNKAQPYATNIQYSASGTLTQMTFGNSRTEARDLNARLQTQMIALCPGTTCGSRSLPLAPSTQNFLNLQLGYSPTANNGNITSQTVSALGAFSFTQSYEYDAKSRLNKVTEGSWSQTYNYDSASLGNRWVTQTPGYSSMWPPALSVSPFTPTQSQHYQSATNQINVPAPTTHDNAGNQTNIGG